MTQPNIQPVELPDAQRVFGESFPVAYGCDDSSAGLEACLDWVGQHCQRVVEQASAHGAVLFRGLPIESDVEFDAFVTAFDLPNFTYGESLSNAVRVNRTERVFTANEAPADVEIFLHHEMAQTPVYPSRLFFYCEAAPTSGGATPLCRSDLLFDRLMQSLPAFARDCAAKGLRYSNVMPGENDAASGMGRSWQSTLNANSTSEAEARLTQLGYTWLWQDDGSLRVTTPALPATRTLESGRTSFFNQLIAASKGWKDARNDPSKSLTFGDGSPLDPDDVLAAAALADEITYDLRWQRGDVALVDNYVAMHGRRPFTGTRKVLASLIAA